MFCHLHGLVSQQDAHINCENGQLGCLYSCGISYSLDIILLCYLSLIAISKMLHETSYFLSSQAFPGFNFDHYAETEREISTLDDVR